VAEHALGDQDRRIASSFRKKAADLQRLGRAGSAFEIQRRALSSNALQLQAKAKRIIEQMGSTRTPLMFQDKKEHHSGSGHREFKTESRLWRSLSPEKNQGDALERWTSTVWEVFKSQGEAGTNEPLCCCQPAPMGGVAPPALHRGLQPRHDAGRRLPIEMEQKR